MAETHDANAIKHITLDPDSEYRFEIPFEAAIDLVLTSGTAEIFGCELAPNKVYTLTGVKYALYTFTGAVFRMTPKSLVSSTSQSGSSFLSSLSAARANVNVSPGCSSEYVANETPMNIYMNVHLALEARRHVAQGSESHGPKVLLIGQGRTTLSRTLINYAVRAGRQPLWVDLDISNGTLLFPGTLSAQVMDRVIDPEEGVTLTSPISYFYGHAGGNSSHATSGSGSAPGAHATSSSVSSSTGGNASGLPLENPKLYKLLAEKLASNCKSKLMTDVAVKTSGMFLTSFGWSETPLALELLTHIIDAFEVDTLLVVGNERLHSELSKKYLAVPSPSPSLLTVLKLPKSGGLVSKSGSYRRQEANSLIRRYFYGVKGEVSPFPLNLPFKDVHLRRVGEGPLAPSSALPLGATRKIDETRLVRVELNSASTTTATISSSSSSSTTTTAATATAAMTNLALSKSSLALSTPSTVYTPAASLVNSLIALSSADISDEPAVLTSPILGYLALSAVDEMKNRLTLLSPSPGKLPGSYSLIGSIRFTEK